MNILFLLTPKATCAYLHDDDTVRQALEKMEASRYAALPILAKDGSYRGTLTEGDLLWCMKELGVTDWRQLEDHNIMEIAHRRDNTPVSVAAKAEDLMSTAVTQNFVPVVDDRGTFIGIITRKAIIRHFVDRYIQPDKE